MNSDEIRIDLQLRWVAAALFFAAVVGVSLHMALGGIRHDVLSPVPAIALDGLMGVLWIGASVAMATRIGELWMFVVAGTWAMLGYGMWEGMQGFWPGAPYIVVALMLAYLMAKTAPVFRPRMQTVSGS